MGNELFEKSRVLDRVEILGWMPENHLGSLSEIIPGLWYPELVIQWAGRGINIFQMLPR